MLLWNNDCFGLVCWTEVLLYIWDIFKIGPWEYDASPHCTPAFSTLQWWGLFLPVLCTVSYLVVLVPGGLCISHEGWHVYLSLRHFGRTMLWEQREQGGELRCQALGKNLRWAYSVTSLSCQPCSVSYSSDSSTQFEGNLQSYLKENFELVLHHWAGLGGRRWHKLLRSQFVVFSFLHTMHVRYTRNTHAMR